ncbi:MAG: DUF2974 domain-containing protein [Clostridiaceae bacterium]|nr:DUF2974 domain-containing protein [Clostridiaceae bacterium]
MSELMDNQLLLLDNLIYLNGVVNPDNEGKKVYDIVNDLLEHHTQDSPAPKIKKAIYDKGNDAAYMPYDEWVTILKSIQADPELMNLTIKHGVDDYGKNKLGGMRVACFVDGGNNATVVFRGTGGPTEWHDNGAGGYESDTPQQERALEYINKLAEKGYGNITVTGHSKGGNKAQYVALLSDNVDRCVSFDGQGFSSEFFEKYKDLIKKNSYKVTRIADKWDFVNCLLFPGSKTIYINSQKIFRISKFMYNHCPNTMLDENGNLRPQTDSSFLNKLISSYTQYMNENLEGEERRKLGMICRIQPEAL